MGPATRLVLNGKESRLLREDQFNKKSDLPGNEHLCQRTSRRFPRMGYHVSQAFRRIHEQKRVL